MRTFIQRIDRYRGMPVLQRAAILWACWWDFIATRRDTLCARLVLSIWGAKYGAGLTVAGVVRCRNRGKLLLGFGVALNGGPRRNFVAGGRQTAFWVGRAAKLTIGSKVGISGTTIICLKSIRIGDHTMIGGGCEIYDTDFHSLDAVERIADAGRILSEEVVIGPKVFIGAGTIILKGAQIGEGAVIGAGSLVTSRIPAYEIWAGHPARFIRKLPIASGDLYK